MKKNRIKKRNTYCTDTEVGINYIKVVLIVIIIFALFYLITYLITNKEETATETEPTIQYTEIIAGNILSITQTEYYVLVEFENDKYNSLYETYMKNYSLLDTALPYYIVDMSKGFNKSYIYNESDNVNISELKFKETTLLKIKEGKIIERYESNENIINVIKNISK